jgi:hypothetical protein
VKSVIRCLLTRGCNLGRWARRSFSQSNSFGLLRCNVKANLTFHYASRLLRFALIRRHFLPIRGLHPWLISSLFIRQILYSFSYLYNYRTQFPSLSFLHTTHKKLPTRSQERWLPQPTKTRSSPLRTDGRSKTLSHDWNSST